MTDSSNHEPATTDRLLSPAMSRYRDVLARHLSDLHRPVIVNSFGRSGSTMLSSAVVRAAISKIGHRVPRVENLIGGNAWKLADIRLSRGRCYKSHDYPVPSAGPDKPLVLYLFADPVDATISVLKRTQTMGQSWLDEHCSHLNVAPVPPAALVDHDALHLQDHYAAWRTQQDFSVAFIRYETMWDNEAEIAEFLGLHVALPPKLPRQSDQPGWPTDTLAKTYEEFSGYLAAQPDFEVV